MNATQLADGLWRWTAAHPHWTAAQETPEGWSRIVACTYFEPPDGGVVLIDPLVPADEAPAFWKALDADVERRGGRVAVVLSNAWHGRSAREMRARYCATVHAHEVAATDVRADITLPFAGDIAELPGGLRAHRIGSCDGGECIIELPAGAGLVFGDAVLGIGGGKVRTLPSSWTPEAGRKTVQARLREELRPLLDAKFERLLVSHGEPVLEGARAAFEDALVQPPKGG